MASEVTIDIVLNACMRLDVHGKNKAISFYRVAPDLPTCVTWHKGLWVDFKADGYVDDEGEEIIDSLCVESVCIECHGRVMIMFEEALGDSDPEETVEFYMQLGWGRARNECAIVNAE